MNSVLLQTALRSVGAELAARPMARAIRLVIVGGAAGMLAGRLRGSRTTTYCDVMSWGDDAEWDLVQQAALVTARRLGLPDRWLNRDCAMFAWSMPLGWTDRCELVGCFGGIEVVCVSRLDLIAAKVFSSPKRSQDLEDLRDLGPSRDECRFVEAHLDRLSSEHLDGDTFEDQRLVLRALMGGTP